MRLLIAIRQCHQSKRNCQSMLGPTADDKTSCDQVSAMKSKHCKMQTSRRSSMFLDWNGSELKSKHTHLRWFRVCVCGERQALWRRCAFIRLFYWVLFIIAAVASIRWQCSWFSRKPRNHLADYAGLGERLAAQSAHSGSQSKFGSLEKWAREDNAVKSSVRARKGG